MIAEIGHYALVLALGIAMVQTLVPLIGAHVNDRGLMRVAEPAANLQSKPSGRIFVNVRRAMVAFGISLSAYLPSNTDRSGYCR